MKSPSKGSQMFPQSQGYPIIIAANTASSTSAFSEHGSVHSVISPFPSRATSPGAVAETSDPDRQRHKTKSHHHAAATKQQQQQQHPHEKTKNTDRLGLIQPGVFHVSNDAVQKVSTSRGHSNFKKQKSKGKNAAEDRIRFLEPGAVNVNSNGNYTPNNKATHQVSKSDKVRLIQPSQYRGGIDDGDDALPSLRTQHSPTNQAPTFPEKEFDSNPIDAELAPEEDMTDRVTRQVTDEVTERLRKQFEQANSPDNALVIEGVVPEKDTFLCGLSLRTWIVGLVLLIPIVAGVVLGVVVLKPDSTPEWTTHPTQPPSTYRPITLPPTNERRAYLMDLLGAQIAPNNATLALFHDPDTPQYQAMQWLSEDDAYSSDPESMDVQLLLERYVLAVLYYSTSGPDWQDDIPFLNGTTSVCEWNDDGAWNNANIQGSFCVGGHIRYLRLQEMGLSGTIPWELSLLENLCTLYLGDNLITGTVPTELGSLSNLQQLQAYGNSLSGPLPAHWGSRVEILWFTSNYLSGTLPSELGELSSKLKHLQLGSNNLHGTIPTALGNLTSLVTLELSSNDMSGSIPTQLGRMAPMMYLSLDKNVLTGTLPSEIGQLTSMLKLTVFGNAGLSGTVPEEYDNLSDMLTFAMEETAITGSLDSVFCPLDASSSLEIYADCLGQNPEIECSCCYYCCASDGSDCDYV